MCNITDFSSINKSYCIKNVLFYAVCGNYCTKALLFSFLLDKRKKIEVYRPKKALNFSSFEKQKEYNLALIRTTYQREDGYKETYNNYK